MDLLSLLTAEEQEKYLRPYGEKQTVTYQGLMAVARKNDVEGIEVNVAVPPTTDKTGMYYCVCQATISRGKNRIQELGGSKKADPITAVNEASFLARVKALRACFDIDLECFEVLAGNNPPNPVAPVPPVIQAPPAEPAPEKEEVSSKPAENDSEQTWNKKDTTELATLRKLMKLSQKDLAPYIKDWSHGLCQDAHAITQENIKAFNRYMRKKALEQMSEEEISRALESAWKAAGCLE